MRYGGHKLSRYLVRRTVGSAKTPAGGTEASHRQHTERAATPATSFGEASPAKEQDKMKRPPKPVAGVAGPGVPRWCAERPGEAAQRHRQQAPQKKTKRGTLSRNQSLALPGLLVPPVCRAAALWPSPTCGMVAAAPSEPRRKEAKRAPRAATI